MLYLILYNLRDEYTFLNVFRYITFRGMLAFLVTFVLVLVFQPVFIRYLKERGIKGQPIRTDGPQAHGGKQGTPTMGGFVLVCSVVFTSLMLTDLSNWMVWLVIGTMSAFAAVGFVDDWRKITLQDSKGLSEAQKILWQVGIAAIAIIILLVNGFSTEVSLPFVKDWSVVLGPFFFLLFGVLVIVSTSNAVNLTDGLDGLAIGSVMTVAATYALFSYLGGHVDIAKYLGVHHVREAGEISIILASIIAAGLGFLWYNTFPAQVFMGDLGALSLGGVLGLVAIIVKHEIILIFAGGVFVIEALSVLIQRYYFKATKKRMFRMAPIHHHFELLGWAEPKIIVRFWIVSIVLALISLTTLKLR